MVTDGARDGPDPAPEPARDPDPATLVRLPDPDPATGRAVLRHGERDYAVFRSGQEIVVLDGACPHKGGPLVEGLLRGGAVVCPWHWYAFELATGRCTNAAMDPVGRFEVVELDGVAHVRIPSRPAVSWAERLRAHARGGPASSVESPQSPEPPAPASRDPQDPAAG